MQLDALFVGRGAVRLELTPSPILRVLFSHFHPSRAVIASSYKPCVLAPRPAHLGLPRRPSQHPALSHNNGSRGSRFSPPKRVQRKQTLA